MDKKIKYLIFLVSIFCIVLLGFGITYSVYTSISDSNSTIDLGTKSLGEIIEYENNGNFSGSLNFGNDYTLGIKSSVVFYNNDKNVGLRGYLYLDLISLPKEFNEEEAFKWTVVKGDEVISGNFIGYNTGESIPMIGPFDLSTTYENFEVYVWIDSSIGVSNINLNNENLKLSIRAYAYQEEMDK